MPKTQINLLPQEEFEKKPLGKFLHWALTAGRWIVIITEFIVILAFLSRFKLDRDIADLHEQIQQKQAIIQASASFEDEFRFFQKRLSEIKTLESKQIGILPLFDEIAKMTPIDVAFSKFSYTEGEISLTGTALSEEGLGSLLFGLTTSKTFTDVNLSSVSKKTDEPGIRFTLTIKSSPKGPNNAL